MIVTYKTVYGIEFPVFKLSSTNWDLQDGLLFLDGQLLDDRNMPGETLGIRRLQTPFSELCVLKHSINSHLGLIKNSGPAYIDNKGRPFIYEKTLFTKLIYHRIRKIDKKKIASLLWLKGINFPFTIPRPPSYDYKWAGVLYLKKSPWILYDYAKERPKDTNRKI